MKVHYPHYELTITYTIGGCMYQRISVFLLAALICCTITPASAQLFWDQAGSFSGSTYIVVPNSTALNITGSFTIECWLNTPANALGTLVQKRAGSASEGYTLYINAGGQLAIRTNVSTRLTGTGSVPVNTWTHVAGTYNASTGVFTTYINGATDNTATVSSAEPAASMDSLRIGNGFNGGYAGMMDNVRVWNRALTQTEISRYMRTALGANTGIYSGLVYSLTFEDNDNSGNPFLLWNWATGTLSGVNRGVTQVNRSNRPSNTINLNESVFFDGAGDYLSVPNESRLSTTGAMTVEAWVYPIAAGNGGTQVILSKGTNYSLSLTLSGQVTFQTGGITTTSDSIPGGRWTHVAAVLQGDNSKFIYFNGVQQTNTVSTVGATNTNPLYIGSSNGSTNFFNGYIDEVRVTSSARTPEQIRQFMYKSMDLSNSIGSLVAFNFDGLATENISEGARATFNGDARFSHPGTISNQPVSPMTRADAQNFPNGFWMKTSDRRIPAVGTSGLMVPDSVFVNQNVTITDVNLFVAINHTYDGDIDAYLVAPNGDSVEICTDIFQVGQDDNLIALFDDQADSALVTNRYVDIGPIVRPESPMNSVFSGTNALGYWQLHVNDDVGGDFGWLNAWGVQINNSGLVGVDDPVATLPETYELYQNYPNPFNPSTTIRYAIPSKQHVSMTVYDILGRLVATLVNEEVDGGTHLVNFNAASLSSGTYFYRLQTENFAQTKKLMILK